jgi:hypothetical protein
VINTLVSALSESKASSRSNKLVDRIKRFEPRDSHNSLKLFNVLRTLPFDFDH